MKATKKEATHAKLKNAKTGGTLLVVFACLAAKRFTAKQFAAQRFAIIHFSGKAFGAIAFTIFTLVFQSSFCPNTSWGKVVMPQPYGTEPRFRSWTYYPNTVFRHTGYYTRPTYIEFEENESVSGISISKPTSWDFVPNGNRLYLKPITDDADTTATITTNLRTYFFELHAKEPNGPFDPNVLFFVKFRYPQTSNKNGNKEGGEEHAIFEYNVGELPDLSRPEMFNFNYTMSGDDVISPIAVFDNGKFTYMKFKDVVPAVFSVDADGYEGVVNFRMVGDYMVIERVGTVFTLRNGFATVCVFNEDSISQWEGGNISKKGVKIRRR